MLYRCISIYFGIKFLVLYIQQSSTPQEHERLHWHAIKTLDCFWFWLFLACHKQWNLTEQLFFCLMLNSFSQVKITHVYVSKVLNQTFFDVPQKVHTMSKLLARYINNTSYGKCEFNCPNICLCCSERWLER